MKCYTAIDIEVSLNGDMARIVGPKAKSNYTKPKRTARAGFVKNVIYYGRLHGTRPVGFGKSV
jgi:hypothetical protein